MSTDSTTSAAAHPLPEVQTSLSKNPLSERQVSGDSSKETAHLTSPIKSPAEPNHQRYVFADPVAFNYLEEDPNAKVLERSRLLPGYQCYLVEQWACARTSPTFLVVAHTGDPSHNISVGILSVPADEDTWSPRMKVYFKALLQYHARRKETPLGTLMITNLSGFPSSLTLILVPSGNPRINREDFFVNENLKRLGCSGRVGISIGTPTAATQAKFLQLYKTSDKVPLYSSVIELVKLCQVALMLFGTLEPEYADGLLCDVTEKAIGEWWVSIGSELYNIEPSDGMLGPMTVAAILGTLLGARNRLQAFGTPISKDVFDVEQTKRAIAYFQRSYNVPRTRRLDRWTLDRLHRATDKQANAGSWGVPRAVKSTVAELSGKGGEMVLDMVGGREKAGIAEVETTDIDRFSALVSGERLKWLWLGKPRKRTTRDMLSEHLPGDDGLVFQEGEESGYSWASRRKDSTVEPLRNRPRTYGPSRVNGESTDIDPLLKQTVLKRAKGRLKGAVGIKGHSVNKSKNESIDSTTYPFENKSDETLESEYPLSPGVARRSEDLVRESPIEMSPESARGEKEALQPVNAVVSETPAEEVDSFIRVAPDAPYDEKRTVLGAPLELTDSHTDRAVAYAPSAAASMTNETPEWEQMCPVDPKLGLSISPRLRQRRSFTVYEIEYQQYRHPARWPRNLSFSTAEAATLTWEPIDTMPTAAPTNPRQDLARERLRAADARRLRARISQTGAQIGIWVQERVAALEELDTMAAQDAEQLSSMYYPRKDEQAALAERQAEVLGEERAGLRDATRDVEALSAKLEYEINALRGKVEDVEDAVAEFERQVRYTEGRVGELIDADRREGWVAWGVRIARGLRKDRAA